MVRILFRGIAVVRPRVQIRLSNLCIRGHRLTLKVAHGEDEQAAVDPVDKRTHPQSAEEINGQKTMNFISLIARTTLLYHLHSDLDLTGQTKDDQHEKVMCRQ